MNRFNRAIWLVCSHYWGPLAAFYLWLGITLRNLHLESKWSKWAHELHHCATGSFHLVEQGDLRKSSRPRKDCFHREVMKPFLSVLDGDLEPAFPLPRLAKQVQWKNSTENSLKLHVTISNDQMILPNFEKLIYFSGPFQNSHKAAWSESVVWIYWIRRVAYDEKNVPRYGLHDISRLSNG